MTASFTCTVAGGRLPEQTSLRVASVIRSLDGKQITISVQEHKRKRSNQANNYLWGVVYPALVVAFREHGNIVDSDDVHTFCRLHVAKLKQAIVTPDGEVLHTVRSSKNLTTTEFMDYITCVKAWAREVLGIDVPEPNEQFNQPEGDTK